MQRIAMNAHFWEGFYGMEALEGYQAVYLTPDFNEPHFRDSLRRVLEAFEEPSETKEFKDLKEFGKKPEE